MKIDYQKSKSVSFEIVVTDERRRRRRLHFSSKFRSLELTELHAQLPLEPTLLKNWTNFVLDLPYITSKTFKSEYVTIDSMMFKETSAIRKIFTLPRLTFHSINGQPTIPSTFDFPIGMQSTG